MVDGQVVVSFKRAATGALGSDGRTVVSATNARMERKLPQQVLNSDGLGWVVPGGIGEGGHEGESSRVRVVTLSLGHG